MKNKLRILSLFIITTCLLTSSCRDKKIPDELFFIKAEVLDIKRDDDGQYHLLVRFNGGRTESISDAYCDIYMGNYKASAEMPYVTWRNSNTKGVINAWKPNSTSYSLENIKVFLPLDYNIQLFND